MFKKFYVEKDILEMGFYSAVISFYDGSCDILIYLQMLILSQYILRQRCVIKVDHR